jgi:hypothetical protein
MLAFLRKLVDGRGLSAAALAAKTGVPRARMRKILVGAEPMTLDEFAGITGALELGPADVGLADSESRPPGADAAVPEEPADPDDVDPDALPASLEPVVDPWGNHPEQLFRIGFALGIDFMFVARADDLADSGVPRRVLADHRGRGLALRLDAGYHAYNAPRYDDQGVTITLSFDALYDCRFPWSSIVEFVFYPAPPEASQGEPAEAKAERPKPKLRLVE